jgi:hypothetical protein
MVLALNVDMSKFSEKINPLIFFLYSRVRAGDFLYPFVRMGLSDW